MYYLATNIYIHPKFQNIKVHREYEKNNNTIPFINVIVNGWRRDNQKKEGV